MTVLTQFVKAQTSEVSEMAMRDEGSPFFAKNLHRKSLSKTSEVSSALVLKMIIVRKFCGSDQWIQRYKFVNAAR